MEIKSLNGDLNRENRVTMGIDNLNGDLRENRVTMRIASLNGDLNRELRPLSGF